MGQTTDSRAFFVHQPTAQLSLLGGRFAASVTWSNAGGAGTGQAVQVSDASGYFWFFDPSTIELTAKLIDGAAINGHFWLFVSSATDVGFTLTVVDTWLCPSPPTPGCPVRTYQGQAGTNRNFFDLTSFSFIPP